MCDAYVLTKPMDSLKQKEIRRQLRMEERFLHHDSPQRLREGMFPAWSTKRSEDSP